MRKGTNKYKFRADIDHVKRETLTNGITDPFRSRKPILSGLGIYIITVLLSGLGISEQFRVRARVLAYEDGASLLYSYDHLLT